MVLFCFGIIFSIIYGLCIPAQALVLTESIELFTFCYPRPNMTYGKYNLTYDECHSTVTNKSVKYALFFVAIAFGQCIGFFGSTFCFGLIGERLTKLLRSLAMSGILRQEVEFFDKDKNSTGILSSKLASDADLVKTPITTHLNIGLSAFITLVGCFVLSFLRGWELSLACLGVLPFVVSAQYIEMRKWMEVEDSDKPIYDNAAQVVYEAVKEIRTVASFTLENFMLGMYEEQIDPAVKSIKKNKIIEALTVGYSKFMNQSIHLVGFYFGAYLIKIKIYEPMAFNSVMMFLLFGSSSIGQACAGLGGLKKSFLAMPRVFSLIDMKPKIIDIEANSGKEPVIKGAIEIEDVHFRYPARPTLKVLRGVSLTINEGQTVALVGESGSGKSTVIQLMQRFYDPLKGFIKIDGIKLTEFNLKYLRDQIGLVGQEPVLFNTSIGKNISYSKDDATPEEIKIAAQNANISDFIEKELKEKYETNVGAKGTQLSGGQKQRIAIARAIIRNPRILLLDEATAALDSESEQIVQKALDSLMSDRTTLVIAHRLSTIQNADKIVVMGKGKVRETKVHDQGTDYNR
eukprot:TRINITY_DN246_c0_g1_i12.p1 TRINITY_DN246_c0_g1~~TRINITY_DN246_c0_g1_i12.p1  ORF type:complete len:574 (-),score=85.57 TRINITY_DN246_c0_g1_i12:76-1797(-)